MEQEIIKLTERLRRNSPANSEQIERAQNDLQVKLPSDYLEWVKISNGGVGKIGQNAYLLLWPVEKLLHLNELHKVAKFAPGFIFFGSDGGDDGYAFDYRGETLKIVQMPFIGMSTDSAKFYGNSFIEFLRKLAAS